jgi:hypothetical protein
MKNIHALFLIAFTLLALLLTASTASAVSCHCFQDRAFDPEAPGSVDPYLLATARNGLLAGAAQADKADVVRARMTGETEETLWVALIVIDRTGVNGDALAGARKSSPNWATALKKLQLDPAKLGPEFSAASDDAALARALADSALTRAFGFSPEKLAALRAENADTGEAALAGFVAAKTGDDPSKLLADIRANRTRWGTLIDNAGITTEDVGDLIAQRARPTPP